MLKHFLFGFCLTVAGIATAHADAFRILVPFAAGNQADIIARSIQSSIEKNTQHTVSIINMPGAETILAANHFVGNNSFDGILVSSTQAVWNPLFKPDLVRYKDEDFDYLVFIGSAVPLWVTRPDTQLKQPLDLTRHLPKHVGGFVTSYNLNLEALVRKFNLESTIVPYKGTNQILLDIINGSIDLGIVTPSTSLFQMAKQGKLHIIATADAHPTVIDGIKIPSVQKELGIQGITGSMSIATHAGADISKKNLFANLLWNALNDPETKKILKDLYVAPDATNDKARIKNFYKQHQQHAKAFLAIPIRTEK
jgi:tripartite-type tricarboxylate transporter receptor subunit TctC